jgi:hypothetical protein
VVDTELDPTSHQFFVVLKNYGDKTVTAYTLRINAENAEGQVTEMMIGLDNLYYGADTDSADSRKANLIGPGQQFTYGPLPSAPGTKRVDVTVVDAVYMDRTVEGDGKAAALVFKGRQEYASKLRQAASYSASLSAQPTKREKQDAVQKIRDLQTTATDEVLFETLNVPMGALRDKTRPLTDQSDAQSLRQAAGQFAARAAFWETNAQEVKK